MEHVSWLTRLLSTQAPALPATWAMRLDLVVGWALVLALLGVVLPWRLPLRARRLLAASLALWTFLPGPLSPDYWLGLAFHGPSLSAMLLCACYLWRLLRPAVSAVPAVPVSGGDSGAGMQVSGVATPVAPGFARSEALLLGAAVLLGYALLLDTFAVLPLELYAWGFSPALLLGLLALSLLPWLVRGRAVGRASPALWLVPLSLLLFADTRLPTGNVWDALLDPWLWLLLQLALLRRGLGVWRS